MKLFDYFCPIIVVCSCANMAVNFFPALSCTSMNLDTQQSDGLPLLSFPRGISEDALFMTRSC